MRGHVIIGGSAILAALALAGPSALAGGVVNQGYPNSTTPPAAQGQVAGASLAAATHKVAAPPSQSHLTGALPFTGVQLGVVVLVGILLVGGGLLLWSSGKERHTV